MDRFWAGTPRFLGGARASTLHAEEQSGRSQARRVLKPSQGYACPSTFGRYFLRLAARCSPGMAPMMQGTLEVPKTTYCFKQHRGPEKAQEPTRPNVRPVRSRYRSTGYCTMHGNLAENSKLEEPPGLSVVVTTAQIRVNSAGRDPNKAPTCHCLFSRSNASLVL
ncbi:hypothetical protein BJ508DRAFT_305798 [Ascobolus immersus RN42]|uniref:Uncharacterized protein n=1 Tax=Ascobolus immersus RN42 TaxID=1160509 RepID=A0A3N4IDC4_ASCIM|nr:hypothetical protein BJ508DRAFT_305798 [Ascobolus immersus RN42]